jgi:hypothetical protein
MNRRRFCSLLGLPALLPFNAIIPKNVSVSNVSIAIDSNKGLLRKCTCTDQKERISAQWKCDNIFGKAMEKDIVNQTGLIHIDLSSYFPTKYTDEECLDIYMKQFETHGFAIDISMTELKYENTKLIKNLFEDLTLSITKNINNNLITHYHAIHLHCIDSLYPGHEEIKSGITYWYLDVITQRIAGKREEHHRKDKFYWRHMST